VKPEAVLDTLTPVLGPPTRDTGWYLAPLSGTDGDCLGGVRTRILRWGNLSFAFWNPDSGAQFTLWSWALGEAGEQKEPQPLVDTPPIAATTADGIGIGTSMAELRARYGADVQVAADHKTVFMGSSSGSAIMFYFADGKVIGIRSRLSFC
jgi:hypothetical protein